jgi:hypothetical protein
VLSSVRVQIPPRAPISERGSSHVGLRGLNIAARKAYHALKRFRKFNCIMLTISPYMNDRPHGPFGQLSCLVLKRMCEDHNAKLRNGRGHIGSP